MNALDIALTVVLSYFLLRGLFRGLVKEIVGILGLFVAFWVAATWWQTGAEHLTPVTDKASYRGVLSFVIIYLVVYFLVGLVSVFVDKIVKLTLTPVVSSIFGGVLGLLKGAALSVILLTAVTAFLFTSDSFFEKSMAWSHAKPLVEELKSFLPSKLEGYIGERQGEVRGSLAGTLPRNPARPAATPGRALGLTPPSDYPSLMTIKREHPMDILPAWMEKLEDLKPEALDRDTLTGFVKDHPHLFSAPPPGSPPWPQPDTPREG
ncbi:MAG: CvpA family protein [Deltaproteobacteria bacterium]|jgi:membrane protein required for colicin V production|nr:CvpA family protein [Deltaproteobacteria bacterium]